MQFLMAKNYQLAAPSYKKNTLGALVFLLSTFFSTTLYASTINPYSAEYDVFRKGERYGSALRQFSDVGNGQCKLRYSSKIKWMIFTDEREESGIFNCTDDKITPLKYTMVREGTGKDRNYKLLFDQNKKQIKSNQHKYPLKLDWSENFQDGMSYQAKMRIDLRSGATHFDYPIVDKKGKARHYKFEVIGKETITLPFGNLETIKVKRLYDNDKRQALAWFAPSMDFLLVRMWKGEKGVEQFDIQLKSHKQL